MMDEMCKAKKEAMTTLVRGFYHDFMPMVRQIKDDVSALHIGEQDKEALDRINEQLRQAESLLRQLMTITTPKEPKK